MLEDDTLLKASLPFIALQFNLPPVPKLILYITSASTPYLSSAPPYLPSTRLKKTTLWNQCRLHTRKNVRESKKNGVKVVIVYVKDSSRV
jgi:hypothetical protein